MSGEQRAAYEARGNPGDASSSAFALLVDAGYISQAKDKEMNKAFAAAAGDMLRDADPAPIAKAEKKLEGTPLIPDILIETEKLADCVELAWRNGDYLRQKNRADCAAYILKKLRNYAREMGWADK